jgi:L-fuculose-phosphate aldolase
VSDIAADLQAASTQVAALVRDGLLSALGGNVSLRSGDGFWITAAGRPKHQLNNTDWVHVDLDGRCRAGEPRPSSEWRVHATVYRARPDVGAIIHGHAPAVLAWGLGADRLPVVSTETALLGPVAVLDWIEPGGGALADAVASALSVSTRPDAVLLRHHGFVAVGSLLAAAGVAARALEVSARIALDARVCAAEVPELSPAVAEGLRRRYRG